jgi:hypothetical protein
MDVVGRWQGVGRQRRKKRQPAIILHTTMYILPLIPYYHRSSQSAVNSYMSPVNYWLQCFFLSSSLSLTYTRSSSYYYYHLTLIVIV